jgi:hypothetical protein
MGELSFFLLLTLLSSAYSYQWSTTLSKNEQPVNFININDTYVLNIQICSDQVLECSQTPREIETLGGFIKIQPVESSQVFDVIFGTPVFTENLMWKVSITTGSSVGQTVFSISLTGNDYIEKKTMSLAIGGAAVFSNIPTELALYSLPITSVTGLECSRIIGTSPLAICLLGSSSIFISQNEFQDSFVVDLADLSIPTDGASACDASYGVDILFWNAVSFQEYVLLHTSRGIFKLVS